MKIPQFELKYTTTVRVRYADTDKMGFVYNGNYFAYFEVGRTELMRHYGLPYTEFENAGYYLPLTETQAKYISPAYYDDLLSIEAILEVAYIPIVTFRYNISRGDTTIAMGYTKHIFIDAKSGKTKRPPRFFFEAMEKIYNLND